MIENFILKNQQKIFIIFIMFAMWCFYSVVSDGGAIIPRIEKLEKHNHIHVHENPEHNHRYHDGAAIWK